jgi:thiol-disulfide isomerase/thioredoxin
MVKNNIDIRNNKEINPYHDRLIECYRHIVNLENLNNKIIFGYHFTNCPFSHMFNPVFDELKNMPEFAHIVFYAHNEKLNYTNGCFGIPTIVLFKNNELIYYDDDRSLENLKNWIRGNN